VWVMSGGKAKPGPPFFRPSPFRLRRFFAIIALKPKHLDPKPKPETLDPRLETQDLERGNLSPKRTILEPEKSGREAWGAEGEGEGEGGLDSYKILES
jgi:hypothetical protein